MVLATTGERRAPKARTAESKPNVGKTERQLSAVAGAALTLLGLRRRDIGGGVIAAVGAALVHRGITGHCHVYDAMGMNSADQEGGNPSGNRHRSDVTGAAATVNARKAVKIETSTIVAKPTAEV